ncbi:hypothetical protein GCM10022258_26110 [Aquimarina gracilis]
MFGKKVKTNTKYTVSVDKNAAVRKRIMFEELGKNTIVPMLIEPTIKTKKEPKNITSIQNPPR